MQAITERLREARARFRARTLYLLASGARRLVGAAVKRSSPEGELFFNHAGIDTQRFL